MKFPWTTGRSARREAAGAPATADERTHRKRSLLRLRNVMVVPLAGAIGIGGFGCASSLNSHSGRAASEIATPLHTNGGSIVDAAGRTVTITGVNWFGFETSTFAPHGLWARNYKSMLDQIAASGFNAIRLPYSNALFRPGNTPNGINYTLNPDLKGLRGLALMDKIVDAATRRGLMIILDQHRPDASGQSPLPAAWTLSEQQWIDDWVMLARHYRGNPLVVGADLHNEPHGSATWGTGTPQTDWRLMAQKAGNAVLAANPDWLVFVEGVDHYQGQSYWWGGDLAAAKRYPVTLSVPQPPRLRGTRLRAGRLQPELVPAPRTSRITCPRYGRRTGPT